MNNIISFTLLALVGIEVHITLYNYFYFTFYYLLSLNVLTHVIPSHYLARKVVWLAWLVFLGHHYCDSGKFNVVITSMRDSAVSRITSLSCGKMQISTRRVTYARHQLVSSFARFKILAISPKIPKVWLTSVRYRSLSWLVKCTASLALLSLFLNISSSGDPQTRPLTDHYTWRLKTTRCRIRRYLFGSES